MRRYNGFALADPFCSRGAYMNRGGVPQSFCIDENLVKVRASLFGHDSETTVPA